MSLSNNTKIVNIEDLHFPKENVRMHTQRQIKEIIRSIEMFGQIRPTVIDENNVILAGCGLVEALTAKGETTVEVYQMTGLSENQKKKLMIADNKVYSLGVDNLAVMEKFIHELSNDLDIPGFDESILQAMVSEVETVTRQIADYGKIDTQIQNSLNAAGERKEILIEQNSDENSNSFINSSKENVYQADNTEIGTNDKTDINRFIVCPKCGWSCPTDTARLCNQGR